MNWTNEVQNWAVACVLATLVYVASGPIFRSANSEGRLTWRSKRWRRGGALVVLLTSGAFDIFFDFKRGHIGFAAAVGLSLLLGWLTVLFLRWWWQDWEKEKVAREALVDKLHQEGRELVLPRMSRGQKVWNWILIVYGTAGLLGGLCAIILHLLGKY
jgi:hypothetical protein